jgi:hypothetical protein
MAMSFNKQQGSAHKNSVDSVKFVEGDNQIRIVGDILARYVYWVKGENEKNIPMECLGFNRDEERFDNVETDWVRKFFPDQNCSWSYATQAVVKDEDGTYKVQVVNLKKKLWEQIMTEAEDLGDPTDPKTGWDLRFKRVKTGPLPFNVEYRLQGRKCEVRPLLPAELEAIEGIKSMDDVMPRPTPEAQKELLERLRDGGAESKNLDPDVAGDFDIT